VIPLSLLFVLASLGLLLWGLVATSQVLIWGSLGASVAAGVCLSVSVLRRRGRAAPTSTGLPRASQVSADRPVPAPDTPSGPSSPFAQERPPAPPPAAIPPYSGPPYAGPPPYAGSYAGPPPRALPPPYAGPPSPPWPTGAGTGPDTGTPAGQTGATAPRSPTTLTPSGPGTPGTPGTGPSAGGVTGDTRTPAEHPPSAADAAAATAEAEPPEETIQVGAALRAAQLEDEVLVVDGRPRYHLGGCRFLAGRSTVPLPLSTARRSGFTPCGLCRPDSTLLARARAPRGG